MTYLPSPLVVLVTAEAGHDAPALTQATMFCDFVVLEFAALRHFQGGSGLLDGADEQALVGVAGHDRRAGLTAFEHAVATIQTQTAQLRIAVTVIAVIG